MSSPAKAIVSAYKHVASSVVELMPLRKSVPDATVIFLHGLGDTAYGWSDTMEYIQNKSLPNVKFILPTATEKPVTINMGMTMPAWFDVLSLDRRKSREDTAGIDASADFVAALVQNEIERGLDPRRIIIGGFSQGGAIALHCNALKLRQQIGGVAALSTYIPIVSALVPGFEADVTDLDNLDNALQQFRESNLDTFPKQAGSIFLCHGKMDPLIPFSVARASEVVLKSMGYSVDFHSYMMEHSACNEEIQDLITWLSGITNPSSNKL